jgi:hypothetical protein
MGRWDALTQKLLANHIEAAPARDHINVADATRGAKLSRTVMPQISGDVLAEPGDPVPIDIGLSDTVSTDTRTDREPPCSGVHNYDGTCSHVPILPFDYSVHCAFSPPR